MKLACRGRKTRFGELSRGAGQHVATAPTLASAREALLTVGVHVLAQLRLGLSVGPVAGLVGQAGRHGGGGDHGFEGALPLLHVELRVEDDDVDFGHVEHPEGHGRAEVHGDGEGGGLDVELWVTERVS